ncbi:hypothetical protein GCM10018966_071610 [Streptomyces yanii]
MPAIHRNRDEIRQIFLKEIPGVDPRLDNVPATSRRRGPCLSAGEVHDDEGGGLGRQLRIAETGTLSVVESEGNGRMCLTCPTP